jgi:hypothetical protein
MNKVEFYHDSAWVDISNYVEDMNLLPYNPRNRDWTIQIETWEIDIAITIRDLLSDSGFVFSVGDKFRTSVGSQIAFSGLVTESNFDYDKDVFAIKIKSNLSLISENFVTRSDVYPSVLHDQIMTSTNWWEHCEEDYVVAEEDLGLTMGSTVIQCLWLMQCCFALAGLTLTVSEIEDVVLFNRPASGGHWGCDITYKDFIMHEEHLWCINQEVATPYYNIQYPIYTYNENIINCLELIQELIPALNLGLAIVNDTTYKLIATTSNNSIADDDKFSFASKKIISETDYALSTIAAGMDTFINYLPRDYYYSGVVPLNLDLTKTGFGKTDIKYLNNFAIFYTDAKTLPNHYRSEYAIQACTPWAALLPVIDVWTWDFTTWGAVDSIMTTSLNTGYRKLLAKCSDYTEETILTNVIPTAGTIAKNNIDIAWDTSEIIQETY